MKEMTQMSGEVWEVTCKSVRVEAAELSGHADDRYEIEITHLGRDNFLIKHIEFFDVKTWVRIQLGDLFTFDHEGLATIYRKCNTNRIIQGEKEL